MHPQWSLRIWDMYIDAYYAKFKYLVVKSKGEKPAWVKYASKRFWSTDGKWYGY